MHNDRVIVCMYFGVATVTFVPGGSQSQRPGMIQSATPMGMYNQLSLVVRAAVSTGS